MKILGVIGARSGSRTLPHKNIKPLLGKPLMSWIIEAARQSKYLTRIVLSTDSEEYARIGRAYGAETPFIRPAEFASDQASDIDYLRHAALWLAEHESWKPDIIVRLPPTSPLCTPATIDACIELLLQDQSASSSRTITKAPKHPYKLWKIEDDVLKPFIPKEVTGFAEPSNMARQLLPPVYAHVNVIAVRYATLVQDELLTGPRVRYHLLDREDEIDIDNEIDFIVAEQLLEKRLHISS